MTENTICGPGYTAQVPPGFIVAGGLPAAGVYRLLPPGVSPNDIEALLQIRSVQPFELEGLLQNLYAFDFPVVAQQNAANLGLLQVTGTLPIRQMPLPQGPTTVREFNAMTFTGIPVRAMVLLMRGPQSAVEMVVIMNLFRWMDFVGPCLSLLTQVSLQGVATQAGRLEAVVDDNRRDQIEYQLISADHAPVPLTALPTVVGGTVIIQVDTLIQTGNINGTGIAIGPHSLATVTQQGA